MILYEIVDTWHPVLWKKMLSNFESSTIKKYFRMLWNKNIKEFIGNIFITLYNTYVVCILLSNMSSTYPIRNKSGTKMDTTNVVINHQRGNQSILISTQN